MKGKRNLSKGNCVKSNRAQWITENERKQKVEPENRNQRSRGARRVD